MPPSVCHLPPSVTHLALLLSYEDLALLLDCCSGWALGRGCRSHFGAAPLWVIHVFDDVDCNQNPAVGASACTHLRATCLLGFCSHEHLAPELYSCLGWVSRTPDPKLRFGSGGRVNHLSPTLHGGNCFVIIRSALWCPHQFAICHYP